MKNGKLTVIDRKTLIAARRILDEFVNWQRENPKEFRASEAYVAQDASKAIETFLTFTH